MFIRKKNVEVPAQVWPVLTHDELAIFLTKKIRRQVVTIGERIMDVGKTYSVFFQELFEEKHFSLTNRDQNNVSFFIVSLMMKQDIQVECAFKQYIWPIIQVIEYMIVRYHSSLVSEQYNEEDLERIIITMDEEEIPQMSSLSVPVRINPVRIYDDEEVSFSGRSPPLDHIEIDVKIDPIIPPSPLAIEDENKCLPLTPVVLHDESLTLSVENISCVEHPPRNCSQKFSIGEMSVIRCTRDFFSYRDMLASVYSEFSSSYTWMDSKLIKLPKLDFRIWRDSMYFYEKTMKCSYVISKRREGFRGFLTCKQGAWYFVQGDKVLFIEDDFNNGLYEGDVFISTIYQVMGGGWRLVLEDLHQSSRLYFPSLRDRIQYMRGIELEFPSRVQQYYLLEHFVFVARQWKGVYIQRSDEPFSTKDKVYLWEREGFNPYKKIIDFMNHFLPSDYEKYPIKRRLMPGRPLRKYGDKYLVERYEPHFIVRKTYYDARDSKSYNLLLLP